MGACPSATRLALLEERVKALEGGQQKEAAFREAYYADQRERVARDARLDEKISAMDEKLDKVVAYQEAQQGRPAKRWEGMVDRILWAVCAAVIAFLLGRIGL